MFARRTKIWAVAAVAAAVAGGGGVAMLSSASANSPGDINAWMQSHCQSVADQKAASVSGADQVALQADQDATAAFLGSPCPTTTTTTTVPPTTTTTVPPTTSTTVPPSTTTTLPATTTTVPPTTTTVPPTTTTVPSVPSCGLQLATGPMAFCDTFSSIVGANPASRSGDLNAQIWGVSRTNSLVNIGQHLYNQWFSATLQGCGAAHAVMAPRDVQICNGRVVDATADHEGQSILAMYPKQPFDIAGGRTGTVGFDVSGDSASTHAAWPEFWWTDQPIPAPTGNLVPLQEGNQRNSFGFTFASQCGVGSVGVDTMVVTRNYVSSTLPFTGSGCVTKGSVAGGLNHVEVRVSQNQVQVYATNAGSTSLQLMATAANANLTMTRGVVWIEDVHYNACKYDAQCDHTFAWDNVGFDGPTPYRDLSFDVPDASTVSGGNLGWLATSTPLALHTLPVFQLQPPTSAIVTFNAITGTYPLTGEVPQVRVNGGPWHSAIGPTGDDGWRTFAITIPLTEINVGNVSNTVEFKTGGSQQVVSNVNLILIAGSPVT